MTDASLTWRPLHFAVPLALDQVVDLLRQFAAMTGSPRLILEADGSGGQVNWRVGADVRTLGVIGRLVESSLAGSTLSRMTDDRPPTAAAVQLSIRGHREQSIATARSEATVRALLAALSRATRQERLRIQIVLGVRLAPTRPRPMRARQPGESEARRLLAERTRDHGFGCVIRVGVQAADVTRQRALIGGVLAALRLSEAPGQRIQLRPTSPTALTRATSPWRWPMRLSVSDLAALLGWPVGELPLPGVAEAHPRPLRALAAVAREGRVLGTNQVAGSTRPIALSLSDSLRHLHLLGPTGTGKSTLIAQLALQDVAAGRRVVVIDPKGDLIRDLLARIPAERQDDVVLLDATDEAPVGLNPLVGDGAEIAADGLVAVMRDLYADAWGPRTQDILHASLLSLARRGDGSLVHVPLLLTNAGFRRSVTGRVAVADPMGLGSFWSWYESISDAERSTVIAPLMNKLRPVLLRPGLRAMLGQTEPKFDLRQVFAADPSRNPILLVNLAKGDLGADAARLVGSVVVSLLWQRALERSQLPAAKRVPVMVFIDEVQDYLRLPGDLGDALAQARGLGVGFTLAHQHLGQLPTALKAAILANTRSRVCFQLAQDDATVMARGSGLDAEDFTRLPAFQAYASLLAAGSPTPYASLATMALGPKTSRPAAIRRRSRDRYGQPRHVVEESWGRLAGAAVAGNAAGHGESSDDESFGRVRRGAR